MKKYAWFGPIIFLTIFIVLGCGYTTSSSLPPRLRTIYIEPFKNNIDFTTTKARNLYFPLLEVEVHDAIVNRILFDGNLRIAQADNADLILKGELVGYERQPLRYTDDQDVEEYRVQIIMNLTLCDVQEDEVFWEEKGFVGEATYFATGALATTESAAIEDAKVDLARRIIERIIENW